MGKAIKMGAAGGVSKFVWYKFTDSNKSSFKGFVTSNNIELYPTAGTKGNYYYEIVPYDLDSLSWTDIVTLSRAGYLSYVAAVGDTKKVTLTTNEVIELQIADFNHDTFADGTTAPVTFVMKDCLKTTASINSSGTNAGGYPASAMKTYVETNIYNKLPSDLQSIVAPVKKKWYTTYNQTSSLTEGTYNVWLLSEMEVFGTNTYTIGTGEGTKYSLFTDATSRIKKVNNSALYWWLGSANGDNSSAFVRVDGSGGVYHNGASFSIGVCVGLCIR